MVKYKYIVPGPVMRAFIYIAMADADHKQKEVGPEVTENIYEIATSYLTKKGSNNH